jgi:BMFP domain-containing protein YqiC
MNEKFFDEMSQKIASLLPPGVKELQQDAEKNIRAMLQSGFQQLNLVTREEFDVQQALLQRSREKLEALERRLAALEAQMSAPAADPNP